MDFEAIKTLLSDKVLLTIKGIQIDPHGEEQIVELITEGRLYRHEGRVYLEYMDAGLDSEAVCTMLEIETGRVTVHRDTSVPMEPNSFAASSMVFQQGRRYESIHETALGRMELGVFPSHVQSSVQGDEGEVALHYQLDMGGRLMGNTHLEIHYSPRQHLREPIA